MGAEISAEFDGYIIEDYDLGFLIVEGYTLCNRKRTHKKWNTGLSITRRVFDALDYAGFEDYIRRRGGSLPPSELKRHTYYFHKYRPDF